jgi:ABC-2 type transport system permease protein
MKSQIRAILWAQFRTIRNYLPRSGFGTLLMAFLSLLWYGIFIACGTALAVLLPTASVAALRVYLPVGLLGVFLFWQLFPLLSLSSGWSLELNKLLIYPVRESTLFLIEVLLRLSTAPEMIIVLGGAIAGLMRHPRVFVLSPLWLLLYIPFNLLLSLAVREWATRMFRKKRLNAVLLLIFVAFATLPNLLANTALGAKLNPIMFSAAKGRATPWFELSSLALGPFPAFAFFALVIWLALAFVFARRQFARSLHRDHSTSFVAGSRAHPASVRSFSFDLLFSWPNYFFRDPVAALVEKDLRVLARSPRFRVIFGMACLFSVVIFFPFAFGKSPNSFFAANYLPGVSAYGLLIVGEVLLWNTFGFDRKAAQLYFVAPVSFAQVLRAKNIVAFAVIGLMTLFIAFIGALFRTNVTFASFVSSVALTFVLTLFFLAFGNVTSVLMPRPIDPSQAFRNQNSAKTSLWLLLCFLVLLVPVGLAFVAKWAFDSDWAYFSVLAIDFVVGSVCYRVATDAAVTRAERDREKLIDTLSKGADPIGL